MFAMLAYNATAAPPAPADDQTAVYDIHTEEVTDAFQSYSFDFAKSLAEAPQVFYLAQRHPARTKAVYKNTYRSQLLKRLRQAESPPGNNISARQHNYSPPCRTT